MCMCGSLGYACAERFLDMHVWKDFRVYVWKDSRMWKWHPPFLHYWAVVSSDLAVLPHSHFSYLHSPHDAHWIWCKLHIGSILSVMIDSMFTRTLNGFGTSLTMLYGSSHGLYNKQAISMSETSPWHLGLMQGEYINLCGNIPVTSLVYSEWSKELESLTVHGHNKIQEEISCEILKHLKHYFSLPLSIVFVEDQVEDSQSTNFRNTITMMKLLVKSFGFHWHTVCNYHALTTPHHKLRTFALTRLTNLQLPSSARCIDLD